MSEGVDLIDIYADEEFNQVRGSTGDTGGVSGAQPRHTNGPREPGGRFPGGFRRECPGPGTGAAGAEHGRFGEGKRPEGPVPPVVPARLGEGLSTRLAGSREGSGRAQGSLGEHGRSGAASRDQRQPVWKRRRKVHLEALGHKRALTEPAHGGFSRLEVIRAARPRVPSSGSTVVLKQQSAER